jgi:hypothetical protein
MVVAEVEYDASPAGAHPAGERAVAHRIGLGEDDDVVVVGAVWVEHLDGVAERLQRAHGALDPIAQAGDLPVVDRRLPTYQHAPSRDPVGVIPGQPTQ